MAYMNHQWQQHQSKPKDIEMEMAADMVEKTNKSRDRKAETGMGARLPKSQKHVAAEWSWSSSLLESQATTWPPLPHSAQPEWCQYKLCLWGRIATAASIKAATLLWGRKAGSWGCGPGYRLFQ